MLTLLIIMYKVSIYAHSHVHSRAQFVASLTAPCKTIVSFVSSLPLLPVGFSLALGIPVVTCIRYRPVESYASACPLRGRLNVLQFLAMLDFERDAAFGLRHFCR
jgi:hypothetical protein